LGFPGIDWIRRRQRTLTQGVLALFCAVWLQAALVPCAMAFMPDGAMAGGEEHCVYCPPERGQSADPAADTGVDCLYPDGPQVDTRPLLAFPAAPLVAAVFVLAPMSRAPAGPVPRTVATVVLPRPALAVSYCRFLK